MDNNVLVKKVMPVVLVIVIGLTMVVMLTAGDSKKKNNNKEDNSPKASGVTNSTYDSVFTGVITGISPDKNEIIIYNIKYQSKYVMNYTGGTDIKNKYGKVISMSSMELGQIVDVGYNRKNMRIVSLRESSKSWEYKNLNNFSLLEDNNTIRINDGKYQIDESLSVSMDGVIIDRSKVLEGDEITVRGIKNHVYSINVTKGHGTMSFENYDALLDGMVMVGNYDAAKIEKGMRLTVAEGTYNVWFVNGKLKGEKVVTISRNEETRVDLGDIYLEPTDTALVSFKITPDKAILYVDGIARKYNDPVELDYGDYDIDVDCDGYNSYKGKISVKDATVSVVINLTELPKEDDSQDEDDKSTQKPQDEDSSDNDAQTTDDVDKTKLPADVEDDENNTVKPTGDESDKTAEPAEATGSKAPENATGDNTTDTNTHVNGATVKPIATIKPIERTPTPTRRRVG